ncbi:MAG: DUF2249 domain-containing protein [Actinobacteria bacterium]|jgi:uncharacterized protein (DUF2249 family)/hemerythrin-like domain-containing protein|nr:DUF2249 domain-containing protein [Actinomycetota bacterium]MCL6104851.1 DUF2249 domain-containing protein [Actinomycetota bacterium]
MKISVTKTNSTAGTEVLRDAQGGKANQSGQSDDEAFSAMLAHHKALVETARECVKALNVAIHEGDAYETTQSEFITYFVDQVLPHAKAEEETVYPAAATQVGLGNLVERMIAEHRELEYQLKLLQQVTTPFDVMKVATHMVDLFEKHVNVENQQILPVLLNSDVNSLSEILSALHEHYELLCRSSGAVKTDGDIESEGDKGNKGAREVVGPYVLDVRNLPPAQRHQTIFATFNGLAPLASFVLVNDHDPKPLYYQFNAEYTGEFGWEYLESGPEVWRVRIFKQ